jgi:hypothetical protein
VTGLGRLERIQDFHDNNLGADAQRRGIIRRPGRRRKRAR